MALQLILGGSGSGKSHYLYQRIIKEAREQEAVKFLVLVPEQFTMQTQKDFVRLDERHGILNIDVLSFMRLAFRILEESKGVDIPVLEDMGKNMVLLRVLEEKKDELIYFQSNRKKPGFIDEMKSLLSELAQYNIREEELLQMLLLSSDKPMLEAKLKDLLVVYQGFRDYLANRYITAEEIMDVLYDSLPDSEFMKNSIVCLDGFTGFTPSQYQVLERIIKIAKNVYVTVTIDEREDIYRKTEEFHLFHLSKTTISHLMKLAKQTNTEVLAPIYPNKGKSETYRFIGSPELSWLEKNIFRYPSMPYPEQTKMMQVHVLKNSKEEVKFVAATIRSMVRKEGYRYRDFAVVSGAMESYGRILSREFDLSGIPYFLDDKRPISKNPFVLLIQGVLKLSDLRMDYQSMFHYLRCGMLSFEDREIDALDNYCFALGIRGKKAWSHPFVKLYKGITEEDLVGLNETRIKIMEQLMPAMPLMQKKKHTVEDYVRSVYAFVTGIGAFEKLCDYIRYFEEKKMLLHAKEYEQVYEVVMGLFERMMELLKDEGVTVRQFLELFAIGVDKAKVGLIPTGIDQVVAGDIERTRLNDIRILFFIGVNDGIIPKAVTGGGVLSDSEREVLKERNVILAPTRREKIYTEQFYLYLNVTKPKERVFLTFCKVDEEGKAAKPSYLIAKMKSIFPKLVIEDQDEKHENLDFIYENEHGIDAILSGIREFEGEVCKDSNWVKLYSFYWENPELKEKLVYYINAAFRGFHPSSITQAAAKALYGESLSGSVTRLERFAACALAHFLSYGLRMRERQEFKIHIPDMGNIFHAALELFSKKMSEQGYTFMSISDQQREELSDLCVTEATNEYGNYIFQSSGRNEYMVERIRRILKRTVWALSKQLCRGEFIPNGYELSFSYMEELESVNLSLEGNHSMRLSGRIDRVDVCNDADNIFVKVVDYKSGQEVFDILDVYYGLKLQLIVYLSAVLEKTKRDEPDKQVLPAGIFYYNINDPLIERTDETLAEAELLKELRMNGLVNQEERILKAFDSDFGDPQKEGLNVSVKSSVIPVETLKGGELSKNSSVADTKTFEKLSAYARKKMIDSGNEILNGSSAMNPYKLMDKTACDYCSYQGVCGLDRKMPDSPFRILEPVDRKEVFRRICEENGMDKGSKESN